MLSNKGVKMAKVKESTSIGRKVVKDFVVDYDYSNRSHWYQTYKSGWHVEGGETSKIADYGSTTINFKKQFANNPTVTLGSIYTTDDENWNGAYMVKSLTASSMVLYSRGSRDGGRYISWRAEGMIK